MMKKHKTKKKQAVEMLFSIIVFVMANIAGFTLAGCQSSGGGAVYKSDETDRINQEEDRKEEIKEIREIIEGG